MTSEREYDARRQVSRSISRALKQLRGIETSVDDHEGESLPVIAARLEEVSDRLRRVADETREVLTAALNVVDDEDDEEVA